MHDRVEFHVFMQAFSIASLRASNLLPDNLRAMGALWPVVLDAALLSFSRLTDVFSALEAFAMMRSIHSWLTLTMTFTLMSVRNVNMQCAQESLSTRRCLFRWSPDFTTQASYLAGWQPSIRSSIAASAAPTRRCNCTVYIVITLLAATGVRKCLLYNLYSVCEFIQIDLLWGFFFVLQTIFYDYISKWHGLATSPKLWLQA